MLQQVSLGGSIALLTPNSALGGPQCTLARERLRKKRGGREESSLAAVGSGAHCGSRDDFLEEHFR